MLLHHSHLLEWGKTDGTWRPINLSLFMPCERSGSDKVKKQVLDMPFNAYKRVKILIKKHVELHCCFPLKGDAAFRFGEVPVCASLMYLLGM